MRVDIVTTDDFFKGVSTERNKLVSKEMRTKERLGGGIRRARTGWDPEHG